MHRFLFSIFNNAYHFAELYQRRPRRLWPSVKAEFRLAWALLPCAVADCSSPWSTHVTAVDASPSGVGVVSTTWDSAITGKVGRVSERSRFRGELRCTHRPRSCVEAATGESDDIALLNSSDSAIPAAAAPMRFEEAPYSAIIDSDWGVRLAKK